MVSDKSKAQDSLEKKPTNPEHQIHAKPKPAMQDLKPSGPMDKVKFNPKDIERIQSEQADLMRIFVKVFESKEGAILLDHLYKYAHKNFPNYDNVNATFSKIGEQTLVAYIKAMLFRAKSVK